MVKSIHNMHSLKFYFENFPIKFIIYINFNIYMWAILKPGANHTINCIIIFDFLVHRHFSILHKTYVLGIIKDSPFVRLQIKKYRRL
jgi:hypothetical protein